MRCRPTIAVAALGAAYSFAGHAQPAAVSPANPLITASGCRAESAQDIVVCGRPRSEKYRLPPGQRHDKPASDSRQLLVSRELECRNVGPQGCGTNLLPIVRVEGDGRVVIGEGQ